jgi:hypothetical protein
LLPENILGQIFYFSVPPAGPHGLGHKPRTFDDFVKETTTGWKTKVAKAA